MVDATPRAATARPARPPSALRRAENSAAAHTKAADMAKPQRAAEAFKLDWWFTKKEKTLEALSVSVGPLPSRTGPEPRSHSWSRPFWACGAASARRRNVPPVGGPQTMPRAASSVSVSVED